MSGKSFKWSSPDFLWAGLMCAVLFGGLTSQANGEIIISQYYENDDDERFLEFVNVGPTSVAFDGT